MSPAPILSEQLCDIQGMLNSGFGWLTDSRFWLLTIRDGREDRARKWLSELARSGLMVTAKRVLEGKKNSSICEAVAIAFSFAGLAKLGVRETSRHPFPTPFRSGMGSALRESLLRDIPRQQWRWSDVEGCTGRQTVLSLPIGGCQMQSRKCRPLIKMRFAPSRPLKTARAPSRMASCMSLSAFAMALRNL